MKYEELGKGIVRRRQNKELGLFIDGTGLDRATRRLNRKVDLTALVRGVTSGISPLVSRYYTLIPYEDDSRHRAFLDAVERAGLTVIVKRLPPKGVTRQVSIDIEMGADIVAFAMGHTSFSSLSQYNTDSELNAVGGGALPVGFPYKRNMSAQSPETKNGAPHTGVETLEHSVSQVEPAAITRVITVVCPGRDLTYPISLVRELGVDTVTADFGQFCGGDILKSAAKWIDLSDSETIWK